jgi:integrase
MFGRGDHTETWAAAIDGWTASLRVSKSPTTIRQRRWQLRKLAETYAHRNPFKLSLDELEAWLGGQDWNAESRKSARGAVRSFYAWAVKTGRAKRNPAEKLDPITVPRRLPRPASDAVLLRALDGADDRLTLMLLLAAQAGLRVHEIAKLRWDSIDGDWLIIRGKRGTERRVGIPARLLAALEAEQDRRATGHLGSGFRWRAGHSDPAEWVFPGRRSGGMNPTWVSQVISHALGDGTTAHQLRHRAATVALEGTKNLAAVQDFLGHAKPETTRIYARVGDDALRAVADSL